MQSKWDYIDEVMSNSFEEIKISEDYNEKLISRLESSKNKNKNYTAAVSFIMAGLFMMLITTTNIQYKMLNLGVEIRSQVISAEYEYNYRLGFINDLLGE